MQNLLFSFKFVVNNKIYLKDPDSSELGKKIVHHSIELIAENGFENFNFKKLGEVIQSNESSIYRYFESKHKLLVYLCNWYWSWVEYELVMATNTIENPTEKLNKAILIVTRQNNIKNNIGSINIGKLYKIMVAEFVKILYTHEVDEENKDGYFAVYKSVINRVIAMIEEINPKYIFSKSLVSSSVQGALHQHFLMQHLTTITSCKTETQVSEFYVDLIQKAIQ